MQSNGFLKRKLLSSLTNLNSIVIQKSNQTSKPKQFFIGKDVVEVASSVKLLGIQINDQLNFNLHISNICKSASKQLNALDSLERYLVGFEEGNVLMVSYYQILISLPFFGLCHQLNL